MHSSACVADSGLCLCTVGGVGNGHFAPGTALPQQCRPRCQAIAPQQGPKPLSDSDSVIEPDSILLISRDNIAYILLFVLWWLKNSSRRMHLEDEVSLN